MTFTIPTSDLSTNTSGAILFITSRVPYPPRDGRRVSLYKYCEYLSRISGGRLVIATFAEEGAASRDDRPLFISFEYRLSKPSLLKALPGAVARWFGPDKIPLQASLYWDRSMFIFLLEIIRRHSVRVVIGDMIRTGPYLTELRAKFPDLHLIADLDDLLSLRYQRQLDNESRPNPIGPSGGKGILYAGQLLNRLGLLKYVIAREARLLRHYEIVLATISNATVLVSQEEVDKLRQAVRNRPIVSIPPGVDRSVVEYRAFHKRHAIVFVGSLRTPHNAQAIKWFLRHAWPTISMRDYGVELYIVGSGAGGELERLTTNESRVLLLGMVDDIRPIVASSKVMVAPLWFGSGVNLKILQAMALGVPVVTTPIGAEGLGVTHGVNIAVAENAKDFVDSVCRLLADEHMAERIGQAGRRHVQEKFMWESILGRWDALVEGNLSTES
jgi:glycosyltransferase involved in cell wall biosynthesis